MDARRVTLELTTACDNRCVFCSQAGFDAASNAPREQDFAALRVTADELTFVGGEPLLVPELAEYVGAARSAGFARIGVQTNGRKLGAPGVAQTLARAGLTDVHFSLHGATAAVHDYHTGISGSFDELLRGMDEARGARLEIAVTTLLTRSNYRVLAPLPPLLVGRGASAWVVALPSSAGRARTDFDRVLPRLSLSLPFALHAVDAARRLGLAAWVRGAPLCLLGPLAHLALEDVPRAYGAPCSRCAARAACPGLDSDYLERFGGDELRSRAAPPGPPALAATREARPFVGAGRENRAAETPDRSSPKRALPIAGKVRPALKEVSRGAQRKTGEALQEILPELFSRGDD